MADKRSPMKDSEVVTLCWAEKDRAIQASGEDADERIEYYNGIMKDTPSQRGRSSVTSTDFAECADWVRANLLRIFCSTDAPFRYEPTEPTDEDAANQANEYVNYVFMRECGGYRVLRDAIDDACKMPLGVVKVWWDDSEEVETEHFTGLSDEALVLLDQDPELEITEHTEEVLVPADEMNGTEAVMSHDVTVKRTKKTGRLRASALAPEDLYIDRDARTDDEALFMAHRSRKTRSELIQMGYPRDKVEAIPSNDATSESSEEQARREKEGNWTVGSSTDTSMERVDLWECYIKLDVDGDGIAEMRRIDLAGDQCGEDAMLRNEEWEDDHPFAIFAIDQPAHSLLGRSIYDETKKIQQVKTVLLRQGIDNLYLTNMPRTQGPLAQVENPDELMNPTVGGHVDAPVGTIEPILTPFVAANVFGALDYFDGVLEKRTGVSRATQAIDPEALSNQTATAVQAAQSNGYVKQEYYARNIAEGGMTRTARLCLNAIVKNQDRVRTVRLRNKWVDVDPRSWNSNMDVSISVGLGTGSRDRDFAGIQYVLGQQKEIMSTLGPGNPVQTIGMYVNAVKKGCEVLNIKAPDQFFGDVTPEIEQQMAEQMANQPDPEAAAAEAKAAAEQQKAEAQLQLEQQKAMAKLQLEQARNQAELQAQRESMMQELALEREKMMAEVNLAAFKAQNEARLNAKKQDDHMGLRIREQNIEADLALREQAMRPQQPADTNIARN